MERLCDNVTMKKKGKKKENKQELSQIHFDITKNSKSAHIE